MTRKLIIPKTLVLPSVPNGRKYYPRYVVVEALVQTPKFMSEGDITVSDISVTPNVGWPNQGMYCVRQFAVRECDLQRLRWVPSDLSVAIGFDANGVFAPDSNTGWEGPQGWYCPEP